MEKQKILIYVTEDSKEIIVYSDKSEEESNVEIDFLFEEESPNKLSAMEKWREKTKHLFKMAIRSTDQVRTQF